MAISTVNRKHRRSLRAGCWLVCLGASVASALVLASHGTAVQMLWLALPAAVAVAGHRWMKDPGGVPVIVYHSVTPDSEWLPWAVGTSVTPSTFERHLQALQDLKCNVITTAELVEARRENRALPKRPVVIHFDDGYLDNWVVALPLLKRFDMKATLFVSTDFIEEGTDIRPRADDRDGGRFEQLECRGYLNWAELKAMDSSGAVDVQSHGVDHGRVVTGPREVGRLAPDNWRSVAWVQWAQMNGNKSSWFRHEDPPRVPYGSPVFESGPALASRAWKDGRVESEAEYEARARDALERSRHILEESLAKEIRFFCWPYNKATPEARRLAEEAGYRATTGGTGENRPEEDPSVISRITALDNVLGQPWPWLDNLVFRARIRMCHGIYYWYLLLLPVNLLTRAARSLAGAGKSARG